LELWLSAARAITICEEELRESGLSVFISTDFKAYNELRSGDGWPKASAFFDSTLNDFLPHSGFWIGAKSVDSQKIVITQAIRVDDLGSSSLRDLWKIQLARWYGNDISAITIENQTPILDEISGVVAYHGDLFVQEGFRGGGVAAVAARYAMACAAIRWRLDWVYGLQVKPVLLSGFGIREGYLNWQPLFDEWQWGSPFLDNDDFVGFMSAGELNRMLRAYHPRKT